MNREEELMFTEYIKTENKVYRLNREGELRLHDEWRRRTRFTE